MTRSKNRALWIAGPVQYTSSQSIGRWGGLVVSAYGFNFVGATRSGEFRRYRLIYSVRERKFTASSLVLTEDDKAHASRLMALYMPIAVRRDDLPDGGIAVALKAMLTAEDLAALAAASIKNRDLFSKGDPP